MKQLGLGGLELGAIIFGAFVAGCILGWALDQLAVILLMRDLWTTP